MTEIFIILGLIALNGIFTMSEIAMVSDRKSKLGTEAKKDNMSSRAAFRLTKHPGRFLSTIQIRITLIGILTFIYSGSFIASEAAVWLEIMGVSPVYASAITHTVIVIVVTYLTLILGELLPKRIGLYMSEPVAKTVARPISMLSQLALPFVWLLSTTTASLFKLLKLKGILEGLVGNMHYDKGDGQPIVKRTGSDCLQVDGQFPMYCLLKYFSEEDVFENNEYNTVAGLCIHTIEHIPMWGGSISYGHTFRFEMIDMDGAHINKVLVKMMK